jgi:SAM-dependent methyltransferase
MSLPDYEYKGLMAQAWDVLRGGTSTWPDRAFYVDLIQIYGQPVLDVGCGTGRLLLDYLAQGIDIDGVDNSPDMLGICRQKAIALGLAPTLYEQYLETLVLPRQYHTIMIPSSTLQLVIDPAMAVQSLQRLAAHLLPGGVVVASFMTFGKPGDTGATEWEQTAVRTEWVGDGGRKTGAVQRPIEWGVTTVGFDPVAEIAYTRVAGAGQATHLGRFTQTGDVAVDVTTGNARGTWTLTAANGDMLFLEMEAKPGIDSTHGVATFTVMGGTGRFQGASGSYQQIITFTVEPGTSDTTFTDVLTGMISFAH